MKAILLLIIVTILWLECPRGYWTPFRQQFRCLWRDLKESIAVRVAIVFLLIFLFDGFLLSSIQSVQHPVGVKLIRLGGAIGQNVQFWMFLIAAYAITKLIRRRLWSQLVLGSMFSAALTGLLCNVFKIVGLRSRPQAGQGSMSFFNLEGYLEHKGLFMSFASGDVALVAGAAGFLFHFVKDPCLRVCIVIAPLLTSASRIYLNRHWPSDTLLSLALGLVVGYYLYRAHRSVTTNYSQLPLFFRVHRPLLLSGSRPRVHTK